MDNCQEKPVELSWSWELELSKFNKHYNYRAMFIFQQVSDENIFLLNFIKKLASYLFTKLT